MNLFQLSQYAREAFHCIFRRVRSAIRESLVCPAGLALLRRNRHVSSIFSRPLVCCLGRCGSTAVEINGVARTAALALDEDVEFRLRWRHGGIRKAGSS